MAVEEIKNFDSNEGIKKENVSTNKVDYNNPSKKIMEENDPLVKKEQDEADDLLPENIEKKRGELAKRVNNMEESPAKESYKKLLGMTQVAIDEEDRSTANTWLTNIEEKIGENTTKNKTIEYTTTENNNENITKNIKNSEENNEEWLKSLLDDEERMNNNEWKTNIKFK